MTFLMAAVGIVSLVCWIMVLIKMFQTEGALKGILGIICSLYAFIWGWMNATRYNLKNIMLIWTIVTIVWLILYFMYGATMLQGMPQTP